METKKLFKITDRQGLVIYINNAHVLRRLRRYGHIMYYSRRLHYVILYVDQSKIEEVKEKILALHNVTRVERSEWPNIDPTVFRLTNTGVYKKNDEDD